MPGRALSVADALAAALAERGAASLRFDKRGVSESEDDYLTAGFQAETDDAFAAGRTRRRLLGSTQDVTRVSGSGCRRVGSGSSWRSIRP
jgi:uncharacterized protein